MIEGGGSSEAWYGAKNLRCRGSDTFSRLWNFMARWYNWRAPAQPLRTDVSRAKESMSPGGKITLRRELIERGGSHEVWYGGEGGDSKSRKPQLPESKPQRSLPEPFPGKCSPRPSLKIPFKGEGLCGISKGDKGYQPPRSELRRMRRPTGIMSIEPISKIRRVPNIVLAGL